MPKEKQHKAQLKALAKANRALERALEEKFQSLERALEETTQSFERALEEKTQSFGRALEEKSQALQQSEEERARVEAELQRLRGDLEPSLGLMEKPKPSVSASKIFGNPVDYDEFSATVDLIATFIPNERLRVIRNWQPDQQQVDEFAEFLRTKYKFALSLVHNLGGSETHLVDHNLQCIVSELTKFFDVDHRELVHVQKIPQPDNFMAKTVEGEHSIFDVHTNVVVIGCEATGISTSHRQCIPQLLALCGNGAMGMYNRGVALNKCVTLGIAFADTGIQFCGVYLLDKSFPMFLNLSTVLHPLHEAEDIAKWMLRFVYGATLSLDDLPTADNKYRKDVKLELNGAAYFIKPVREGYKGATFTREPRQKCSILPSRLDHILRIYDRLHANYSRLEDQSTKDWAILFPEGCITVPSTESSFQEALTTAIKHEERFRSLDLTLRPCLLFARLQMAKASSDSLTLWRDFKPPKDLVQPYLTSLRHAVTFLNNSGVIHYDLRPSNVLWRSRIGGHVEVMLIDFDDALFTNQRIPRAFAKAMRRDARFPLYKVDDRLASVEHNNFYVEYQDRWLQGDCTTFDDFMINTQTNKRKAERGAEEKSSRPKYNDDD